MPSPVNIAGYRWGPSGASQPSVEFGGYLTSSTSWNCLRLRQSIYQHAHRAPVGRGGSNHRRGYHPGGQGGHGATRGVHQPSRGGEHVGGNGVHPDRSNV